MNEPQIMAVEAVAERVVRMLPETIEIGSEWWLLYLVTDRMCAECGIKEEWDAMVRAKSEGEFDV